MLQLRLWHSLMFDGGEVDESVNVTVEDEDA